MNATLALNIGEAFVEAVVNSDAGEALPKRWFLPGLQLPRALTDWLKEHKITKLEHVRLATGWVGTILHRRLSSPPALLVTSGFESWIEISEPPMQAGLHLHPARRPLPVDHDHVLGVRERTLADGHVEIEPSQEDLEFLLAKLKLLHAENVALGFLHAQKNPANEQRVGNFLREAGLHVCLSSEHPTDLPETSRWRLALHRAYAEDSYRHWLDGLCEIFSAFDCPAEHVAILTGQGLVKAAEPHDVLSTIAGPRRAIASHFARLKEPFCYFGLEEFFDSADGALWLQPLQTMTNGPFGIAELSERSIQYEVGPMGWGRGQHATVLDILWQLGLATPPEIAGKFQERSSRRVSETLLTLSRALVSEERPTMAQLFDILRGEIIVRLQELEGRKVAGPLAPGLMSLLPKSCKAVTSGGGKKLAGFEVCTSLLSEAAI